uniref:THAP-type domain-containing protein n=1 Tax=Sipha flava TaxID=143950 RepID=A0A2S2QQH4_9HEMI
MVNRCCIKGCRSREAQNIKFHRFPNGEVGDLWLAFIKKYYPMFERTKSSHVCAVHFKLDSDYENRSNIYSENKLLKRTAVPSFISPIPERKLFKKSDLLASKKRIRRKMNKMPSSDFNSEQIIVPTTQSSKKMDVQIQCNSTDQTNVLPSFNSNYHRTLFPWSNVLPSDEDTGRKTIELSFNLNTKPYIVPSTQNSKKKDINIPCNNINRTNALSSSNSHHHKTLFPISNLLASDKDTERKTEELSSNVNFEQIFAPTTQNSKKTDVQIPCNNINRTNTLSSSNSHDHKTLFPIPNLLASDEDTERKTEELSSNFNFEQICAPTTQNSKKTDVQIPCNSINQTNALPSFNSHHHRTLFSSSNLLASDDNTERETIELSSNFNFEQIFAPTTQNSKKTDVQIPCNSINQTNALPSFNNHHQRTLFSSSNLLASDDNTERETIELSSNFNFEQIFAPTTQNSKKTDVQIPCNSINQNNALPSFNSHDHRTLFPIPNLLASDEDTERETIELSSNFNFEQNFVPTTQNLMKNDNKIPCHSISQSNQLISISQTNDVHDFNSPSHRTLFPSSEILTSNEDIENEIVELPALNLNSTHIFVPITQNLEKMDIEIPSHSMSQTNALPSFNSLSLFPTSDALSSNDDAVREIAELSSLNFNFEQLFVPISQHSNAVDSIPSKSPSPLFVDGEIPMFLHTFVTFINE